MDWKKLVFLPLWLILALSLLSGAGLVWVFTQGLETAPIAYGIFVFSFYTLCVLCVYLARVLPGSMGRWKQRVYANPTGQRYMTDRAFRTRVSLRLSLGVNLLYVGMNLLSWFLNRSWWFIVLALYYVIMAFMRFFLLKSARLRENGLSLAQEWQNARLCACTLLLVNLSLSGAVLMILYQDRGFDYPGILIYVVALYTFYSAIHAAVNIVRYRSLGSPVLSAAKLVSLSAALVSVLSLETAMFSQFGAEMARETQRLMIILTGAGISAVIVTLSVLLIIKSSKNLRSLKNGNKR